MAKKKRTLVALVGPGIFHVTVARKDKKLKLKKYSPILRQHVLCSEKKVKH